MHELFLFQYQVAVQFTGNRTGVQNLKHTHRMCGTVRVVQCRVLEFSSTLWTEWYYTATHTCSLSTDMIVLVL